MSTTSPADSAADPDMLSRGQRWLALQPFSVLLGARLLRLLPGEAEFRLAVRPALQQQHGFVHGGVLGYLADNAIAMVAGSVLGDRVVTSEYKLNFLRPALGTELVAAATVLHAGKMQAVCRCDVWSVDAQGARLLCVTAQGTVTRLGSPPPSSI